MSRVAERTGVVQGATLPFVLGAWAVASMVTRHAVLFTRPFWLDEYHTVLVASRATPAAIVRDLAAGVDLAPPLLHLTAWGMRLAAGTLTPTLLHGASCVGVAVALALVYATLRRRFDPLSSTAGAMAVGSHPLVVSHAFEARYYGPWLALCAFFCWTVGMNAGSRRRGILVGVAAVLVCAIHWFGAITLVLMCSGVVAWPGLSGSSSRREVLRRLYPALAGLGALLLCLPLLVAQRSHFVTPIWVPDLDSAQLLEMARTFYIAAVPVAALIVLLASTYYATPGDQATPRKARSDPGITALAALGAMPAAVVLVSLLVQPAMLPRYAIAASLAWAPLVAVACSVLRAAHRLVCCALLAVVWWVNLSSEARSKAEFARAVDEDSRAFDSERASGVPIVFQSRHVLYAVAAKREAQRAEMALLVMPDSLLAALFPPGSADADMDRFFRFERDAVRLHRAAFGFPSLVAPATLDSIPRFVLIGSDASLPRGYKDVVRFGRAVFPGFHVTRIRDDVALFMRQ